MKKVILTLMAAFAFGGSISAQGYETHWPFNYSDYENQGALVAAIMIDDEIVDLDYEGWNALEVAAFVGDECRGNNNYLTDEYVYEFGDPFPILDGIPIYYNNVNEPVSFMMYDHVNDILYTDCTVTYLGEPIEVLTGEDYIEGWYDPENPIILKFSSPGPVLPALTLYNDEKNSQYIAEGNYYPDVKLEGRTLYKNGNWNTLCLPFDVTIENSPLAGAEARTLTYATDAYISEEEEGLTLNLNFGGAVEVLEAGKPYIIKWEDDGSGVIKSPTFYDVTITQVDPINYDNDAQGARLVSFIGTYDAMTIGGEDKSILFMGVNDDNESVLYYPNGDEDTLIGAFRAYFKIGDNDQVRDLTAFNLDFGGDKTGILNIEGSKQSAQHGAWHSLEGVKQQGKPARKGLYIHEGRKVVISR
jgi:hypothetical protein